MTAGFNRQTLARLERAYGKFLAAQEDPTGLTTVQQRLAALKAAVVDALARPNAATATLSEVLAAIKTFERTVAEALKKSQP